MRTGNLLLRAIVPMIAALAAACSDDGADDYAVRLDRTVIEAGPLSGV